MKKNLLLRLCLILSVALTISSCRTDQFPEQEKYNNSSKFQLTSKRISLDEAKHKTQLLPEIEKAESSLKNSKMNVNGRVIDYGNGVSIDTNEVIYIENGPNYHTYTFHIKRENAPASAPVENLVLSPMADGSYKEVLVSYHLTASEKETLNSGGLVDTKGKTTITELANGTYSPLAEGMTSCGWVETYTIMGCSDVHNGVSTHNEGNVGTWEGCTADRKPGLYMTMTYRCDFTGMTDDIGNPGGSSGSSGDGGSGGSGTATGNDNNDPGNNTSPCPNGGTLTEPPSLTNDPGDGNCSGIPTQINLPLPTNDPCRKTKASMTAANNVLKNPEVQTKMDAVLKGKTQAPNEWGVAIGQKSNGYEVTNVVEGIPGEKEVAIPVSQLTTPFIGDGHSHAGGFGRPSGGDLYEMLKALLTHVDYKYRYVYGDYFGVPENYALIVDDRSAAIAFLGQFPRSENYDESTHMIKEKSPLGLEYYKAFYHADEGRSDNSSGEVYDSGAIAMAYILEKYNSGISISKADANGTLKKINVTVQQITVPGNGAVKEGVIVSKCP